MVSMRLCRRPGIAISHTSGVLRQQHDSCERERPSGGWSPQVCLRVGMRSRLPAWVKSSPAYSLCRWPLKRLSGHCAACHSWLVNTVLREEMHADRPDDLSASFTAQL